MTHYPFLTKKQHQKLLHLCARPVMDRAKTNEIVSKIIAYG